MKTLTGTITSRQAETIRNTFNALAETGDDALAAALEPYEDDLVKVIAGSSISKARASQLIDVLFGLKNKAAASSITDEQRALVEALRPQAASNGFIASVLSQFDAKGALSDRQWAALEKNRPVAPVESADTAPATPSTAPEGIHITLDEDDNLTVWKVQVSQKSGNRYAKQFHPERSSDRWDYVKGGIKNLSEDTVATAELAARFGALYGACVFCMRELSDERSIAVGYGPDCASNKGLPWGDVEEGQDATLPTVEEVQGAPFQVVAAPFQVVAELVLNEDGSLAQYPATTWTEASSGTTDDQFAAVDSEPVTGDDVRNSPVFAALSPAAREVIANNAEPSPFEVVGELIVSAQGHLQEVIDLQAGDEDAHPIQAQRQAEEDAAFAAHQEAEDEKAAATALALGIVWEGIRDQFEILINVADNAGHDLADPLDEIKRLLDIATGGV